MIAGDGPMVAAEERDRCQDLRRDRRRVALVGAALAAVLLGVAVPLVVALVSRTSSADFADTEVLAANRLGAAVLDIAVVDGRSEPAVAAGGDGSGPAAVFSATNLAPGDSVSGHLELRNAGDLPLRFGVSALTDGGPLATWLRFEAWPGRGACAAGQAGPRLAEDVTLSATPTVLVDPRPEPVGRGIELEPGGSAVVCLGAHLPLDTPNEAQGQSLDVTVLVQAEQVGEDGR